MAFLRRPAEPDYGGQHGAAMSISAMASRVPINQTVPYGTGPVLHVVPGPAAAGPGYDQ
jgi:hypothetical protein